MYQKLVLVIRQHNGDDAPQDCKLSADSFCNKFPSISVAHSVLLKADYNAAKTLLEKTNNEHYKWDMSG